MQSLDVNVTLPQETRPRGQDLCLHQPIVNKGQPKQVVDGQRSSLELDFNPPPLTCYMNMVISWGSYSISLKLRKIELILKKIVLKIR